MEYKIVTLESQTALAIRDTCTFAELGAKFGEIYSEIGAYLKANSIKPAGYPFGIYHSVSDEKVDLEAGIPVTGEPAGSGRIYTMQTYFGKAANTAFVGPYEQLSKAWKDFAELVDADNHKLAGPCFEVYVTDPEEEPDSSKWITELYTPVE
ncbi:MAG TPA: GyrI-like domain-containing protein [Ignavibacteria bacterium]|nr:GyrI-like domain-containing protein [Ignavibacteria bacterium]